MSINQVMRPVHLRMAIFAEWLEIITCISIPILMLVLNIFTKEFISLEIEQSIYALLMLLLTSKNLCNISTLFRNFRAIEGVRFSATTYQNDSKVYDGGTTAQYNQTFAVKLYNQMSIINCVKLVLSAVYIGIELADYHRLTSSQKYNK